MYDMYYFKIVMTAIIVSTLLSCNKSAKIQIEDCLGVHIPNNSRELKYYEIHSIPEKKRPYYKFIKFKIDTANFRKFITKIDLISKENDFTKLMCLEKVDGLFVKKLWTFESSIYLIKSNNLSKSKLIWWTPNTENDLQYYASFYKEKDGRKIERCYQNEWDGRVLVGYSSRTETIYIFIEVYME